MISIQHTSFHLYFHHLIPGYYLVPNYKKLLTVLLGFPGGSAMNNLPGNSGVSGSIPGLGRSPGKENDNPLQYSCLVFREGGDLKCCTGNNLWEKRYIDKWHTVRFQLYSTA